MEKWIGRYTDLELKYEEEINCHHNYAALENHFGENVWVHRKGAVRARKGELTVIPGAMGSYSYVVRGLGNPESFCTSSALATQISLPFTGAGLYLNLSLFHCGQQMKLPYDIMSTTGTFKSFAILPTEGGT